MERDSEHIPAPSGRWRYGASHHVVASLLAGTLLSIVSCNPYEPLPVLTVTVQPRLAELSIESWRMRDGGVIEVYGVPADQNFQLARGEYAIATLESSAGDSETLRFEPYACCGDSGAIYICRGLTIVMQDGFHVAAIETALNELDVSLTLISASGLIGGGWTFANDVERIAATVSSWAGVKRVTRTGLMSQTSIGANKYGLFATLIAVAPFRVGTPVRSSGVVEAVSGDTIRVSYQQPDGTALADTVPRRAP